MGASFGPLGLVTQTEEEVRAELVAAVRAALGQSVAADSATSIIGILTGIVANMDAVEQAAMQALWLSWTLGGASGLALDALCELQGVYRKPAVQSTVVLHIVNAALFPVAIPAGSLIKNSQTGDQFFLPLAATIPASGYLDVSATSVQSGLIPVTNGITWIWVSTFSGYTSLTTTNPDDGLLGNNVQTDASLRVEYVQTFALPGAGTLEAMLAAVVSILSVKEAAVFENDSDTAGITSPIAIPGIAPHSFVAVERDGVQLDVARVIFAKKPLGIKAWGSTYIDVTDSQGYVHSIGFEPAAALDCYADIHVTGPASLAGTQAQVKAAVSAYVAALGTATPVVFSRVIAIVSDTLTTGTATPSDIVLTMDTAPSPSGTTNIVPAWNEYADMPTTAINVWINGVTA